MKTKLVLGILLGMVMLCPCGALAQRLNNPRVTTAEVTNPPHSIMVTTGDPFSALAPMGAMTLANFQNLAGFALTPTPLPATPGSLTKNKLYYGTVAGNANVSGSTDYVLQALGSPTAGDYLLVDLTVTVEAALIDFHTNNTVTRNGESSALAAAVRFEVGRSTFILRYTDHWRLIGDWEDLQTAHYAYMADATGDLDFRAITVAAISGLDTDLATFALPANTTISAFGASIVDDANASAVLTTLGLDTDLATLNIGASATVNGSNTGDVTLAGTPNYITISGQVVTRNNVNLASHVTGELPTANIANDAVTTAKIADGTIGFADLGSTAKPLALAVADLGDTTTPHDLTTAETTNKTISNYATAGASRVFQMPLAHVGGSVIFIIGQANNVDIKPASGSHFYFQGVQMATDEAIVNTSGVLSHTVTGFCANINGTLRWVFRSASTNWQESNPG